MTVHLELEGSGQILQTKNCSGGSENTKPHQRTYHLAAAKISSGIRYAHGDVASLPLFGGIRSVVKLDFLCTCMFPKPERHLVVLCARNRVGIQIR